MSSIEEALIAQALPYMLQAKAQALIREESSKGCGPEIHPEPVALEPCFSPISGSKHRLCQEEPSHAVPETPSNPYDLIRLRIWLSPEQLFDWHRSESFLKQLFSLSHRLGFEIGGNQSEIQLSFLCHREDFMLLSTVFQAQFDRCELTSMDNNPIADLPPDTWEQVLFYDFYPPPPYSHLLTRPEELRVSPYESLIPIISTVQLPTIALYQVLFQPVHPAHNWHRNMEILQDLEYTIKLLGDLRNPQRYAQQVPSSDLRQMAYDTGIKAHNDKPFYATALRLFLLHPPPAGKELLSSLAAVNHLFQHGGRPLQVLTEADYQPLLSPEKIQQMLLQGLTYRPGFLVNSWELVGLVHLPSAGSLVTRNLPLETLETLLPRNPALLEGTRIGVCSYAGREYPICIPADLRKRHIHLIGRSGMGKSSLLEHMILDDIHNDMGVAVLDPHGDLVERLLSLIPQSAIERTIYFDPGDPNWVPIWNPLTRVPGQDIARTADNLVSAIKNVVTGWGDRLEHLLRHALFALLQLPGSSLLDISNLLQNKSPQSYQLREQILQVIDSEAARQFWTHDFDKYGKDDLGPPKHKLSKLLVSGTISLMLSQPENRLGFRPMMDEGKILLANLSTIGSEVREILGSFLLSLLHLTALSRHDIPPSQRKSFFIYCDEAHRFITDALEDLIAETRKFGVGLVLAHQYLSQFGARKVDAIANVGSTILFNVDTKDAHHLIKDLRSSVHAEDLTALEVGEAIARIGTDIVRLKTLPPLPIPEKNCKEAIITHSRQRYYKPVQAVRETIRSRSDNQSSSTSLLPEPSLQSQTKDHPHEQSLYERF